MSAAPRFPRVARLVLSSALITLVSSMSACVLPIAPEFQDPPTSLNYAPVFQTTDPELGAIVTNPMFEVTVTDPNVGDDLYYRWIADFPPFSENTRILLPETKVPHPVNGNLQSADLMIKPDCVLNNLAKLPRHQIMVVVADRPFAPAQLEPTQAIDLTRVPKVAGEVIATWTLEMECK
jgi:hypothetical protein